MTATADIIVWITGGALLALLAAAEIYAHLHGVRGTLLEIQGDRPACAAGTPGFNVRVRLDTGPVVDAAASPCTICMAKLQLGDRVKLARTRTGYVLATG